MPSELDHQIANWLVTLLLIAFLGVITFCSPTEPPRGGYS